MTEFKKTGRNTPFWVLGIGIAILGFSVSFAWWNSGQKAPVVPEKYSEVGGDFTLTSDHGPVSLQEFRGKVGAVFFGYTHCPDICPASLSNIAAAFDRFKKTEQEKLFGILISIDPDRDSPGKVSKYAAYFHSRIYGLSGSPEEITAVAKQYMVAYQKDEADAAGKYLLGHSSYIFIINAEGRVVDLMGHKASPEDIARVLR
ncbi:MAG: SCO family protein, partial [Mariprofundaceae bacterium]